MSAVQEILVVEAPDADSPYVKVMKTWARWMTLAEDPIRSNGLSHPQDVKEFMSCGEAVDAMVTDLPMHQRWAILKAYGMTTAWRFAEVSFAEALEAAEPTLTKKMLKNVATRRYFN